MQKVFLGNNDSNMAAHSNAIPRQSTQVKRGMDLAIGVCLMLIAGTALAQSSDPMGDSICYYVHLLTGKWAFGLSVAGLAAVGATFMKGVEMNEFMQKVVSFFMVVCLLLAGSSMVRGLATALGAMSATC